jgi:hypothetical protein
VNAQGDNIALCDTYTADRVRYLISYPAGREVDRLDYLKCIIDLKAKATDGAFDLRMPEQKLECS